MGRQSSAPVNPMEKPELSNSNCISHSEAIARIEANTDAIRDHLKRLNGSVAELKIQAALHAQQIATLEAHDEQFNEWRKGISDDVSQMKNEQAETRGGARGTVAIIERVAVIATLLISAWAAYSTHLQVATALQSQPAQQQSQR